MTNQIIVPTGRIIKEYLDENNITQKDLCNRIGMSEKHISNLLNGKNNVTPDFAVKLEKILTDIPASYWINYENKYQEYITKLEEENKLNNSDLKNIAQRFKFKEVFKGLDLNLIEQSIQMLKILKISDFANFENAYANMQIDFMEDGGDREAIIVWLKLCESEIEMQNNDLSSIKYTTKELEKNLYLFKQISLNNDVESSLNSCRKLCNKLGIYLVICDAISNSKVRGALTTYDENPAIFLSGRFKSHDHVWFAFIHEIGHLIKHYNKKDIIISFEDSENSTNNKEKEANEYARDFFINPIQYKEFIKENITSESIRRFANEQKVLPGIVVARLQHDNKIGYNEFSYLKK